MTEHLADSEELLLRQVHPAFVREGRPSSQAFRPMPKDNGKLSVARGSITSAQSAFELHTVGLGLESAGTWAVTVGECNEQHLTVVADPLTSPPEPITNSAHALVDFTPYSRSQREAKGIKLARLAEDRKRLYPPL